MRTCCILTLSVYRGIYTETVSAYAHTRWHAHTRYEIRQCIYLNMCTVWVAGNLTRALHACTVHAHRRGQKDEQQHTCAPFIHFFTVLLVVCCMTLYRVLGVARMASHLPLHDAPIQNPPGPRLAVVRGMPIWEALCWPMHEKSLYFILLYIILSCLCTQLRYQVR